MNISHLIFGPVTGSTNTFSLRNKTLGQMHKEDLIWLAGLLEGEGSFFMEPTRGKRYPVIQVEMTDEDVIQRVARLFGTKMYSAKKIRAGGSMRSYRARVRGQKALVLMHALCPLMGQRRAKKIMEIQAGFNPASVDDVRLLHNFGCAKAV